MRVLLAGMLCWALSAASFAATPLPSVVDHWLRANSTPSLAEREKAIDSIVSDDFESRSMDGTKMGDRDGFKVFLRGAHEAFENYQLHVLDSAVTENRIWIRLKATGRHVAPLMGVEPTDTYVTVGLVVILEILNDKIVQEWQMSDTASLIRQLGSSNAED